MQPQSLSTRFALALCVVGGILAFVGYFFPLVSSASAVSLFIPFLAIAVIGLSTLAAGRRSVGSTLLGIIVIAAWLLVHLFFSILRLAETQIGGGTASLALGFWLPLCGLLSSIIGLAIIVLEARVDVLRKSTVSSTISDDELP